MLDDIDVKILESLTANARTSNKVLSATAGLAASSCLERVRRLKRSGVIRGYHADIDPAVLGINVEALVLIKLSQHSNVVVTDYFKRTLEIPETRSAFIITGRYDVMVHVAVRDTAHLRELLLNTFTCSKEVVRFETVIIFGAEHRHRLPFDSLAA